MARALTLLVVALRAATALAQDYSGKWEGKIVFPEGAEKLGKTEAEKKQIREMIAQSSKITVKMVLNKANTFAVVVTMPDGKKSMTDGTWSVVKGEIITITKTHDGKLASKEDAEPHPIKVSKDGKTLLRFLKEGPIPGVAMMFVRAK